MNKRIKASIVLAVSAIALFFKIGPALYAGNSGALYLTARSAIAVDAKTGRVLYSKNEKLFIPPASTTKLMTAIIILENMDMDKSITISRKSANIEPSKAGLGRGAQYKARDLLSACLMSSSNDAAVALAEGLCGSEKEFAALMNKKARKIGMGHTRFANASGLPSQEAKQHSTVYDLAKLMRYALKKPLIVELLRTKDKFIKGSDGRRLYLRNHNKMLWRRPGTIIGKTGYTIKSRHCFVGATLSEKKKIVFAILSAKKPWQDISILVNYGLRKNGAL